MLSENIFVGFQCFTEKMFYVFVLLVCLFSSFASFDSKSHYNYPNRWLIVEPTFVEPVTFFTKTDNKEMVHNAPRNLPIASVLLSLGLIYSE